MSKLTGYIKESYTELSEKVSWPSREELQSSVIIVMIATAIIGVMIFLMDGFFQGIMNLFYKMIG